LDGVASRIFAQSDFVNMHHVKKQLLFRAAILQSKRQIRLSGKDHQIVKSTKEVSMQYLIPFAVIPVMVLYVLIIVGCLLFYWAAPASNVLNHRCSVMIGRASPHANNCEHSLSNRLN
jgi:hypothetical protein